MRKFSWLLVFLLAVTVINYPNPFNPLGGETSSIECTTDTTSNAFLYIYDMGGRQILRKAFNLQAGSTPNSTSWNGYSDYNELVGNGIYLYMIISNSMERIGKGKIWVINQ
ncbi:MAG: T9SS type A sorting domain-containing protein [Candidatus Margulisiibacteriota bacterium]